MQLPINKNKPLIMHIDLNSCFATVEQQANPFLRNKPIAVAAYTTPNGCIVSPSIEAKRYGVKVGMPVREGKLLCPQLIILAPDPPKYRAVHRQFSKIFREFSPDVVPKSIDEAVINFSSTTSLYNEDLTSIAKRIKQRMREEIGEWISCSIGLGTNRFLAKLAAGLKKPDGLEVITHENLLATYEKLKLIDLCGINTRYQARLNAYGMYTPLDFYHAPIMKLQKQVFQSINGHYWYLRLRGWEIDAVNFGRKSYGQSYSLQKHTDDPRLLGGLLMKLTEKMGRRLRHSQYAASGIHVAVVYQDWTYWHTGRVFDNELFTTQELFQKVMLVFNKQPERKVVAKLAVSCYNLSPVQGVQESLFDTDHQKRRNVAKAVDEMNDRYGEYVITPALMMGLEQEIIDRISFGGVKELEEVYAM